MTAAAGMSLSLEQTRRFSRQIALAEVGVAGQSRLAAARVVLVRPGAGADPGGDVAAEYLAAAGVGRVDRLTAPAEGGEAWVTALTGSDAVIRFSFDDDALLRATVRLGLPAIFGRAQNDQVEVLSFRRQGPCPHVALDVPVRSAGAPREAGAAAALAGTLVAAELLGILVDPPAGPRARLLRLALAGSDQARPPQVSELPWAPECFICGGQSQEAAFTGVRP
jgi:hypothetical protein